jgi:hypothetical protein
MALAITRKKASQYNYFAKVMWLIFLRILYTGMVLHLIGKFTHIAINPNTQKGIVVWLERVTDEEYDNFK